MSTGLEAQKVLEVATQEELLTLLPKACSDKLAIVPGRKRQLPKEATQREVAFIDPSAMKRVIEHCRQDQVIKVETGITVND